MKLVHTGEELEVFGKNAAVKLMLQKSKAAPSAKTEQPRTHGDIFEWIQFHLAPKLQK